MVCLCIQANISEQRLVDKEDLGDEYRQLKGIVIRDSDLIQLGPDELAGVVASNKRFSTLPVMQSFAEYAMLMISHNAGTCQSAKASFFIAMFVPIIVTTSGTF